MVVVVVVPAVIVVAAEGVVVVVAEERLLPKALGRSAPLFRVPRAAEAWVMFRPPRGRAEAEAGVAAVGGETLRVCHWTLASVRWRGA